jgi:Protein of unknown function (DUF1631)
MRPTEPRLHSALEAAMNHVKVTAAAVAERVTEVLGTMARTTPGAADREQMLSAQQELRRNMAEFHRVFKEVLGEKMTLELAPRATAKRAVAVADWESLSLVEDDEVDERLHADRIAQQIRHECETELRELASYMSVLTHSTPGSSEGNPLRAEVLGVALYRGIEAVTDETEVRKLLARDLGQTLARAMPTCYAEILSDLKLRGIKPAALTVRSVDGPGVALGSANSGYATLSPPSGYSTSGPTSSRGGIASLGGMAHGQNEHPAAGSPARRGDLGPGSGPASGRGDFDGQASSPAVQAEVQMMSLLRRLTMLASTPVATDFSPGHGGAGMHGSIGAQGYLPTQPLSQVSRFEQIAMGEATPGAMAVNLIHAHREELRQATGGKLDHMVIDVVGSLFDQILSDTRVPPHIARQIARLQLPVLRVALSDTTFFSSRRHPVRRFVNRMASLACAFEDFDEGPGQEFIARVRDLVQEIVDGDFDRIDLYEIKLEALESFIAGQTKVEAEQTGAVATIESKESELRIQQRYMKQVRTALAPLTLPAYLGDFLSQVWSQALVLAVSREGSQSERLHRYKRVGRDLVMSIQPQGTPALRKKFLSQLPGLMKDLNEGMKFIGWSASAQKEFFGKLLPAHAEALKGQPLSELDHNMLVKQLEVALNAPVPGAESISAADPVPVLEDAVEIEQRFTPEEANAVGLVVESNINWSDSVDVGLGADSESPADSSQASTLGMGPETTQDVLDASDREADEPMAGVELVDQINLGFPYQMHLKDEWKKVRLTYMSPGRQFFVFTRGKKHQETISVTLRMLTRMSEAGRFRAFENKYLMERATHRARKQLAELQAQPQH